MQKVDICVLTAGGCWDILKDSLNAIQVVLNETPEIQAKVYLLDNGSTDWKEHQDVLSHPVISERRRRSSNDGFPVGANAVINMGTAPLVLFVTDDVVLHPEALNNLLNTMSDDRVGLAGLKLIFPRNGRSPSGPAGTVQHVGHCVDIHGEVVHQFIGWSENNSRCCQSGEVFSVTGATFMVRRNLFKLVGGFDPIFGRGTYEDVDLALKIRKAGYKIWLDAGAIGEHYVGTTARKLNVPFPIEQNRSIFLQRWLKSGYFIWDEFMRS